MMFLLFQNNITFAQFGQRDLILEKITDLLAKLPPPRRYGFNLHEIHGICHK